MQNMNTPVALYAALIGLLAGGCASQGAVSRDSVDMTIQVNHGLVSEVQQVDVKSNVGRNAAIGGLLGLATTRHGSGKERMLASAGGALASALVTKLMEGSNQANAYTVDLNNGSSVKVITEQGDIRVGDCVAVETGRTTNIRRVSMALREPAEPHPAVDSHVHARVQEDAAACHQAKEELLKAETEKEIDAYSRKARILCDH